MNKLFDINSPLMQKLAQLPDMILLNVLWLVCSMPIITMGAATTALHAVVFRYVTGTEVGIIKPFFKSFASNFKTSTILWVPMLLIIVIVYVDLVYLVGVAKGIHRLMWVPCILLSAIVGVLVTYAFPLIARYDNSIRIVVSNAFLLFSLHFVQSLSVLLITVLPWLLLLFVPEVFLRTSIFWIPVGGSLIAYIGDYILLTIFKKYDAPEDE